MPISPSELEELLSNTSSLLNQIHWFKQTVSKPEAASHRGVVINYVDIKERREEFLRELKSTVLNWVYSSEKYNAIYVEELRKRKNDHQNTNAYLFEIVRKKFRPGHPQGQFGELLLFNFIQFFFQAPPLLRKMTITTNPSLERNGADAIHYTSNGSIDLFILGESKCYESAYSFNKAMSASVESIVESFNNLENELVLYVYDDFVDPRLEKVAKDFKDGNCKNARIELVCLIAYNETVDIDGTDEKTIKNNIEKCLNKRWSQCSDTLYVGVRKPIIERIHYVAFPIWHLDKLLGAFQ
ncbi:DUF1837 domain-containing protein [Leptothrix ochracea]|uniref:HamA C-terminal domain-containing protein n=1 Tax=Leptothrix ochracea TaxID=735331 RepID=UPI0034E29845